MKLFSRLLTITTQKDDSPEAGLSGDVDEIPEGDKFAGPDGFHPGIEIEEVTEED